MAFTTESGRAGGQRSSRAGIPNKANEEVREVMRSMFDRLSETFAGDLMKVKPETRLRLLIDLAGYLIAKPAPKVQIDISNLSDEEVEGLLSRIASIMGGEN